MQGGYDCHNQGCVYREAQVDNGDGQECALVGQPSYGDLSRCAQIKGAQTQLALHEF